MTVKELIEKLSELPPEAEVLAYDADWRGWCPITGYVYYPDKLILELQTDDNT